MKVEITIRPGTIRLVKMTDAEYFSDAYKDYISNSKLGLINPDEDGSFEKYAAGYASKYSESFELGSAIHAKVLQPDYYNISNIEKPTGKLGLFAEEMFKLRSQGMKISDAIPLASKNADYYSGKLIGTRLNTAIRSSLPFYLQRIKFVEELGKETIFLSGPMRTKYTECMININDNDSKILSTLYPQGMLSPAEFYNEYAILCELEVTNTDTGEIFIIKFKGKLDNFTIDHETSILTLNDLKTSSKPVSYFMGNHVKVTTPDGVESIEWYNGSFQNYHYARQMAIYLWLLQCAMKELYDLEYQSKANMLVVETAPEFKCKVYPINGKHIKEGLNEFKHLISLVVEWMQTN